MIQYYITYTANAPEGFAHGSIQIYRTSTFYNMEQVLETQKFIEGNYNLADVVIRSWTRFERKPLLLILKQLFVHERTEDD